MEKFADFPKKYTNKSFGERKSCKCCVSLAKFMFLESLLTVSPAFQFLCKNQYSSLRIRSMMLRVSNAAETARETALTTKREIFIFSPPLQFIVAMSKTPHIQYSCRFARHGNLFYHSKFIVTINSKWYDEVVKINSPKGADCYLSSRNFERPPSFFYSIYTEAMMYVPYILFETAFVSVARFCLFIQDIFAFLAFFHPKKTKLRQATKLMPS